MRKDLYKPIEIVPATKDGDRGASQLVGPHSDRKKFIAEHILNFINGKISLAQFAKLSKKRLKRIAEMGYIKLEHGRIEEAHRIFQALMMLDSNNPYYHLALGAVFQRKKKDTEAVYHYGRAIEAIPKDVNAYVNRGEIYLRHRNYRKAAQDFRQAILLDPKGRDKYANRARQLVIAIKENLKREKVAAGKKENDKALPGKGVRR